LTKLSFFDIIYEMVKGGATLISKSLIIGLTVILSCYPLFSSSASLRDQAKDLGREKNGYQEKAAEANKEAKSLAEKISLMDEQIEQIGKERERTQKEIIKTSRLIREIGPEISQKELELKKEEETLNEAIRYLYEEGEEPIINAIFSSANFSDALDRTEYLTVAGEKIEATIAEIETLKSDLEERRSSLESYQEGLKELKIQLKVCQKVIKKEQKNKKELLAKTKGKEDRYQQLVKAKEIEQRKILDRISGLEGTGRGKRYIGRPNHRYQPEPKDNSNDPGQDDDQPGSAILQWPLSNFVLTQGYGCTSFARCGHKDGPYGGKPHNGIDISSRPNRSGFYDLRVRAAMSGKVIMVAPEQLSGGWGNAVVIAHPNGLFTLYGHMSRVIVKEGQKLKKGQMIGIEGNTGFSSGRHLHFSVYMEIVIYKTSWYYGPGYNFEYTLNPLIFLPKK